MKVQCSQCLTRYNIKDSLVAPEGIRIRCPHCNHVFPVEPPENQSENTDGITTGQLSSPSDEPTATSQEEEIPETHVESSRTVLDEEVSYDTSTAEATRVQEEGKEESAVGRATLPPFGTQSSSDNRTETVGNADSETRGKERVMPPMDEPSFPAEISNISFNSDISFEDEPSQSASPPPTNSQAPDQEPVTGKANQNPTMINPNPPDAFPDIPTPPQQGEAPFRRERTTGIRPKSGSEVFGKVLLPLFLMATIVVLGAFALSRVGLLPSGLQKLFPSQSMIESNDFSPTPTPPRVDKLAAVIPGRDLKEIRAAIQYGSEMSIEYACNFLKTFIDRPAVKANLALCYAYEFFLYAPDLQQQDIRERKDLVTSALIEDSSSSQALVAAALFVAKESVQETRTAITRLEGKGEKHEIDFLSSIVANNLKQSERAESLIRAALQKRPDFGPYLVFASRILSQSESADLERKLGSLRSDLEQTFVSFKKFSQPAEEKVVEKKQPPKRPKKRVSRPKKVVKRPTPKPVSKPQPTLTRRELMINKGDEYFKSESYNQALSAYQDALKLSGDPDAVLFTKLGNVWFRLYRYDEAYTSYTQAIEADPNQADAHLGLGKVYDHLGDADQAIREFSLYLQLKPNARDSKTIRKTIEKLKR